MKSLFSWRMMPLFLLMVLFLSACVGLAGDVEIVATLPSNIQQEQATTVPEALQMPPSAPDISNGARIFQGSCISCHGITGVGDGELVQSGEVPRTVSFLEPSAVRQQTPNFYYDIITNGNIINLMPPWNESLSVQERWDVAMYVYTLQYTPEQIERGSQLVSDISTELSLESDDDLAAASGLEGDDAYAAVAYQRVQSVRNWGEIAPEELVSDEIVSQDFETINFFGTVTHGTAGNSVSEGQTVELRYGNSDDGVQVLESSLDANNQYRFEGIPFNPDYDYFAIATYQERGFVGELLEASAIQADNEQNITLYEVTEDPSVVVLRQVDFVLEYLPVEGLGTGLVITQQNIYENTSDRLFHLNPPGGNLSASLLMQLPIGAAILNDPNDPRFLQAQNEYAIVDLRPVYPGLHIIESVYFIPYENGRVIDIPVNNRLEGDVNIIVTDSELTITSDIYQLIGEINLGTEDNPFIGRQFTGTTNLAVNESIIFDIEGQVFPNTNTGLNTTVLTQEQLIPIVLVIIAVIGVVAVGIVIGLRSRANDPQREIDRLLQEITELEISHEAGQVNHDVFQEKRKILRDQLAQLLAENTES
jgi:mono/diheme cytochrome c family protein